MHPGIILPMGGGAGQRDKPYARTLYDYLEELTVDKPKRYCIQRYVKANSVKEALEKEPESEIESVFVSEDKKADSNADAIGFRTIKPVLRREM